MKKLRLIKELNENIRTIKLFLNGLMGNKQIELYEEVFHEDYQYPFLLDPTTTKRVDHNQYKKLLLKTLKDSTWHFNILEIFEQKNMVVIISMVTRSFESCFRLIIIGSEPIPIASNILSLTCSAIPFSLI